MTRALIVAVLAAAAIAPVRAHVGSHSVVVEDNRFDPARFEVDPGETVTWFARHGGHTVTADDGSFDVELSQGESVTRAFEEARVFFYHCRIHGAPGDGTGPGSGMAGVIVVGPAVSATDVTTAEGDARHSVALTLTLSRAVAETVGVAYRTDDGTARAGEDYESASGTVSFPPGETVATVPLTVLGDVELESPEWFVLTVPSAEGAAIERARARVTLTDDDAHVCDVPSEVCPTLEAALRAAQPAGVIRIVASIALSRSVTIGVDRVTISAEPGVVIDGGDLAEPALLVRASGVVLEGLTIDGFATGIDLAGAHRYTIRDVTLLPNQLYGIRAVGSRYGRIEDVVVEGASRAGIVISDCDPCDTVVTRTLVRESFIGFEADGATSVVVRDSTFTDNRNGVVLRSRASSGRTLQRGAHVVGNVITGSGSAAASTGGTPAARAQRGDFVVGAGVWVAGGLAGVVERNTVSGGRYGVVVAGFGSPSVDVVVRANAVAGNAIPLGWDGIGTGVCFAENDADAMRSSPPAIESLYPCARPTIGIPNGVLLADLVLNGSR